MELETSSAVANLIRDCTGGKPYVFVVMPFGSLGNVFKDIKSVVEKSKYLSCVRADDFPGAGFDLLEKIHLAIQKAEMVIAEISERNANVFYELGFAIGSKKPVLLIAQRGTEIPTDLRGREVIFRSDDRNGVKTFGAELKAALQRRMTSQVALLRDMLEAERPRPAFIVASPRFPRPESRDPGHHRDRRTFGDNLGILGLLSAFGSIFGETNGVELVSGRFCSPDLHEQDHNLYVIGSQVVNLMTEHAMRMIQPGANLTWEFKRSQQANAMGRYPMGLYRLDKRGEKEIVGKTEKHEIGEIQTEDFGLILRGPHPKHPGRVVMVMAGPRTLGTGAACIAATRSPHIRRIKEMGIDIADRRVAFWALVKGVANSRDGMLDIDDVSIVEVGVYPKAEAAQA